MENISSPLTFPLSFSENEEKTTLDLRGCAIEVCGLWESAKKSLKQKRNQRGLIGRSSIVEAARSLESKVMDYIYQDIVLEHKDAMSARLAVVDWIVHQAGNLPKKVKWKNLSLFSRFMWGYLENTSLYAVYFKLRKESPQSTPGRQSIDLAKNQSGVCWIGFAYGAPTLGAMNKSRNEKGRGKFNRMGLNDAIWSVLEKNTEARAFLGMMKRVENALFSNPLNTNPAPVVVDDEVASEVIDMVRPIVEGKRGGPQFIVSKDGVRMRLFLKLSRNGAGSETLGSDPMWWRRTRYGLFHAVEDIYFLNFIPSNSASDRHPRWGTFDQLHWHLDPVDLAHRKHNQFFAK